MAQSHEKYNKRMEYLVYGYNRGTETECTSLRIPNDVTKICLKFYKLCDHFTIHGDKILINAARNIASGTTTEPKLNIVFGDQVIDLEDDTISEYRWDFRIFQLHTIHPYYIGIADINKVEPDRVQLNYCFNDTVCRTHEWDNWNGPICGSELTLLIQIERRFKWNEDTQMKELDHIYTLCLRQRGMLIKKGPITREHATKFKLGIILSHITQRAQILSFKIKNFPLNNESNNRNVLSKYVNGSFAFLKSIANIQ